VDRRTLTEDTLLVAPSSVAVFEACLQRLSRDMGLPVMEYQVRILNTPVLNSYSIDNGCVYLTCGLLDLLQDRDELIGILGRELYHIDHHSHSMQVRAIRRERTSETFSIVVAVVMIVGLVVLFVALSESMDCGPVQGPAPGSRGPVRPGPPPPLRPAARVQRGPDPCLFSFLLFPLLLATAEPVSYWDGPGPPFPMVGESDWGNIPALLGYTEHEELAADRFAMDCIQNQGGDPRAFPRMLRRMRQLQVRQGISFDSGYPSRLLNAAPGLERRIAEAEYYVRKGLPR